MANENSKNFSLSHSYRDSIQVADALAKNSRGIGKDCYIYPKSADFVKLLMSSDSAGALLLLSTKSKKKNRFLNASVLHFEVFMRRSTEN
jgi:hypothetical protein